MTRGIVVVLYGMIAFSYLLPALCGLSTLLFGVPSRKFWVVPRGTDTA